MAGRGGRWRRVRVRVAGSESLLSTSHGLSGCPNCSHYCLSPLHGILLWRPAGERKVEGERDGDSELSTPCANLAT